MSQKTHFGSKISLENRDFADFGKLKVIMLLQFTVENHLSFDEPTTFSMRAGQDKDLPQHVLGGKHPAVKGAAIYGANAAGKSNLILAMGFARDLIVKGRSNGQSIPVRPFGLGNGVKRPSGFHWQFVHAGKLWSYGFDVTNNRIVEEYLFARDESGGTEKTYFERTTDENGQVEVKFGAAFRGPAKGKLAQRLGLIAENLRAEQPFLTHAIENRVEELNAIWNWFNDVLMLVRAESRYDQLLFAVTDETFFNFLSDFLKFADTGIQKLVRGREPFHLKNLFSHELSDDHIHLIEQGISNLENDQTIIFTADFSPVGVRKDKDGKKWTFRIKARHEKADGQYEDFPLEWESEGTQRLIHLLPALYRLQNEPTVLVIDELDRRLHTLLVQEFVKIALGEKSQGQLIFTTHDTNLLDGQQLRRDEIHFVQKTKGSSALSRLSDWGVRKDLDYEKAYLRGSFEGRPFFGFAPALQGLDVPGDATPPTEEELAAQLSEVV